MGMRLFQQPMILKLAQNFAANSFVVVVATAAVQLLPRLPPAAVDKSNVTDVVTVASSLLPFLTAAAANNPIQDDAVVFVGD